MQDLKGRQLAAARGTTNFTMFEWFAKQQGVDPASLQVVNTATPGLVGYALADRADAVQVWEPAYTLIKSKKPDIHMIDLNIAKVWAAAGNGTAIPNLGVAAHEEWIEKNRAIIPASLSRLQAGRRLGDGQSGGRRAAGRAGARMTLTARRSPSMIRDSDPGSP